MKIAIVGAGYVGKAAASYWQSLNHEVTVSTRDSSKQNELKKQFSSAVLMQGSSSSDWQSILKGQDALLIAVAPSRRGDTIQSYLSTYLYTAQTLASVVDSYLALKQILYISSTSVYGSSTGWVDEETPILPQREEAKILDRTEQTLLQLNREVRSVCLLRSGEIYGPGRLISERLKALSNQPLPGNGSQCTNLIHLEDLVRGLDFALQNKLQGIFNICNDTHLSRKSFYESICAANGITAPQWNSQLKTMHGGDRKVSNSKLKAAGFTFLHPESLLEQI